MLDYYDRLARMEKRKRWVVIPSDFSKYCYV
jgi:hypothetical protein